MVKLCRDHCQPKTVRCFLKSATCSMRFCKAIRRSEFTGSRLDDLIPSDTDCCYGLCQFFPCTVSMLPVEPCQQPALGIIFKDPSPHEFLPPSNDDMIINPFQALAVLSILVPMETSTAPKHKLSISWGSSMKPSSYGGYPIYGNHYPLVIQEKTMENG